MSKETQTIKKLAAILPKSEFQINSLFESDSEIIQDGESFGLFTTDEFSSEDHFREEEGFCLGWNMAVGAISDIFACGGIPRYYLHSITIADNWPDDFIQDIGKGVAEALKQTSTAFLGGDFGVSSHWRYTATVIGSAKRALMRSGAQAGESIYITGAIGSGNIEAFLKINQISSSSSRLRPAPQLRLPIRRLEAELVSAFASACIDTSDGLYNALASIADQSKCGFVVDNIPFVSGSGEIAQSSGLPLPMLFFGEAGEYELLCTIPHNKEKSFLGEVQRNSADFKRIGNTCNKGMVLLFEDTRYELDSFKLRARDYSCVEDYIRSLSSWLDATQSS